jgi:CheY-like chemotaxis protein
MQEGANMRFQYEPATSELPVQLMALDVPIVDENSNDLEYYAELIERLGLRVSTPHKAGGANMRTQYVQTTSELARQRMALDVLIVDENSNDLEYYAELIEKLGLRVFRCASYEAAIYSILRGRTFDLALVDQGSPAFEGQAVLRYLGPFTPVVVLTRNHRIDCYREAMGLGATDYLEKPVSLEQINRVLRQCL